MCTYTVHTVLWHDVIRAPYSWKVLLAKSGTILQLVANPVKLQLKFNDDKHQVSGKVRPQNYLRVKECIYNSINGHICTVAQLTIDYKLP